MNKFTFKLITLALLSFLASYSVSASIIPSTNISAEGVSFEVLHDKNKNSGVFIFKAEKCKSCQPTTLTYQNPVEVTTNGEYNSATITKSTSGSGDISYNPETMTLIHLNVYQ